MKEIIVADDDSSIRDVFSILLTRAGYKVILFSSGELLMQNGFALPDLFIIDKQLSGIDGIEVCRYLKNNLFTQHIPVIITSASPFVGALAAEVGADAFIEKPFKTSDLIMLVEKVLTQHYLLTVNH